MPQGKITVSNFSEQPMNVYIISPSNGSLVTSGALAPAQTSGFLVSGYNQYRVDFTTPNSSTIVTATSISAPADVQIEISAG